MLMPAIAARPQLVETPTHRAKPDGMSFVACGARGGIAIPRGAGGRETGPRLASRVVSK
jgi:hypothetical protein